MQVRFISNVTKEYDDMFKVVIYKEPRPCIVNDGRIKRNKNEVDHDDYVPEISSLTRTKTLIRDIVLSNDFDLFCTFTFDPDKVDRFNFQSCWSKMSRWLHHQKENNSSFTYLIVPEQHKSGAWHFHALISHYSGSLRDSKHKSSSGRPVYNMTSYRSGFSTAVKIDNREAVANYVTKYITKDFIKTFNQRRFFCSRNLKRPIKTVNSPVFSLSLPLFRDHVYSGDSYDIFEISKF